MKTLQTLVLVACAVAAAVATFFGTRALIPHGIEGVIVPLVTASVVGVGLGSVWHLMLTTVPRLQGTGTRVAGLVLGGVLTLTAIAVSTWFVTTAISGSTAVRAHMGEEIGRYRRVLASAHANALNEQGIVPDLTRAAAVFRALAEEEQQSGRHSGVKGDGPVVEKLRRIAEDYDRVAGEARLAREKADQLQRGAAQALRRMDEIVASAETSAAAQKRFAAEVGDLQQVITEFEALSILPGIKRLRQIEVSVPGPSPGQRGALDRIEMQLARLTERLNRDVDAIARQRQPIDPVAFRPIGPGEAVFEYAPRVAAGWAVGIGIDVLPMLLLLLSLVAAHDRRRHEQGTETDGRRLQVVGGD